MTHIAIAGWFGSDNVGDELLLHTLVTLLREEEPGVDLTVLAADADVVARVHGVKARRLAPAGKVAKLRDIPDVARLLKDVDLLLLGPGTVLQERSPALRWPGTLPLFLRLALLARSVGTPVAVLGAAVREGGTPAGDLVIRVLGRLSGTVHVRDEASARRFGGGARAIGDLALAWQPPVRRQVDGRAGIAVSLRPLPQPVEADVARSVLAQSLQHRRDDEPLTFVTFARGHAAAGEDDRSVHHRYFNEHFERVDLPPPGQWGAVLAELADHRLLIATRLHAAVVGVLLGIPTVAISYEDKVGRTMHRLGLGELVVSPTAVEEQLPAAVRHALERSRSFEATAAEHVREVREDVRRAVRSTVDRVA